MGWKQTPRIGLGVGLAPCARSLCGPFSSLAALCRDQHEIRQLERSQEIHRPSHSRTESESFPPGGVGSRHAPTPSPESQPTPLTPRSGSEPFWPSSSDLNWGAFSADFTVKSYQEDTRETPANIGGGGSSTPPKKIKEGSRAVLPQGKRQENRCKFPPPPKTKEI